MKKVLTSLLIILLISGGVAAQKSTKVRATSIGLSFILNDYTTAERIRSTSFAAVRRDDRWAPLSEQSPGIALHYIKGVKPNIDFVGSLGASYVRYPVNNSTQSSDGFLLEGDASGNFKLFTEDYVVTPYVIAGVGASLYKSLWGAFVPLGAGLKVNLFDEASVFLTLQYRVPVTKETSAHHFLTSIGVSGLLGGGKE